MDWIAELIEVERKVGCNSKEIASLRRDISKLRFRLDQMTPRKAGEELVDYELMHLGEQLTAIMYVLRPVSHVFRSSISIPFI